MNKLYTITFALLVALSAQAMSISPFNSDDESDHEFTQSDDNTEASTSAHQEPSSSSIAARVTQVTIVEDDNYWGRAIEKENAAFEAEVREKRAQKNAATSSNALVETAMHHDDNDEQEEIRDELFESIQKITKTYTIRRARAATLQGLIRCMPHHQEFDILSEIERPLSLDIGALLIQLPTFSTTNLTAAQKECSHKISILTLKAKQYKHAAITMEQFLEKDSGCTLL